MKTTLDLYSHVSSGLQEADAEKFNDIVIGNKSVRNPLDKALAPYQVLFALGYSVLFTLAIDFPKYEAFKKFGL